MSNEIVGRGKMTLSETLAFLQTDNDAEQVKLLAQVRERANPGSLEHEEEEEPGEEPQRIRILTMHGAKGLDGAVVFIPWMEQMVMPNRKALQAPGLLMEQRRLFYVALTRTKAVCVVSHASQHQGPLAFAVAGRARVVLSRSQFINELGIGASRNRAAGLTAEEAAEFVGEVDKL